MNKFLMILLSTFVLNINGVSHTKYTVLKIVDGDTITVKNDESNTIVKVRLK